MSSQELDEKQDVIGMSASYSLDVLTFDVR